MNIRYFGILAALTISAGVSQAANIFIDDRGEGFATVSGVPVCNGADVTTNCITTPSPFATEGIFFTFTSDIPTAAGHGGNYFSSLLEGDTTNDPGGPATGGISDYLIFSLTDGSPNINVTVCSDPDTTSLSCSIPRNAIELSQSGATEDGTFQLMAQYAFVTGPNQGQEIDNFYLASDGTPEPGTLLLLGTGLVAAGLTARRKRA